MKEFTMDEVQNNASNLWTVINNKDVHPGGKQVLQQFAGSDATEIFYKYHRQQVLKYDAEIYCIGTLKGKTPENNVFNGTISQIPYTEANFWSKGFHSPYFDESYKQYRLKLRAFFDEHIRPYSLKWDQEGQAPLEKLYKLFGEHGFWAARLGPGPHLKGYNFFGIEEKQFNYFHEAILMEEIISCGSPGTIDLLGSGLVIGLPPVKAFGSEQLQAKVIPEVISGKKKICLAISDANAGSDVAKITCTATKTKCGKFYIVNGVKKWITNGMFADYFTTAVRTGDEGMFGISMLVIERGPGVTTKQIKCSYSKIAATAYIIFDNVKVPVENLLGEENMGFQCIMANFNHERWMICVGVNRGNRGALEECMRYVHQKTVDGKRLIDDPVVRNHLAHMIANVESTSNWLENITYQMNNLTYKQQNKYLVGPISLCKMQCTRTQQLVKDLAVNIFGVEGLSQTGLGQYIESFQKTSKITAIYGGSEEIMADLGIKMAMKDFKQSSAKL